MQVSRGSVKIGEKTLTGDDLAAIYVWPRPDEPNAAVGVVTGSGLEGMKTTEAFQYFLAGVHYPDLYVTRSSVLRAGAAGIEATGYFGLDWSMTGADIAWK
jgi:hypothetical protein